jgi:hypothetical protein
LNAIFVACVEPREPAVNHAGPSRINDTNNTMVYKLAAALQSILKRFRGEAKYRPERHYMRGPGPKARAVARQRG